MTGDGTIQKRSAFHPVSEAELDRLSRTRVNLSYGDHLEDQPRDLASRIIWREISRAMRGTVAPAWNEPLIEGA